MLPVRQGCGACLLTHAPGPTVACGRACLPICRLTYNLGNPDEEFEKVGFKECWPATPHSSWPPSFVQVPCTRLLAATACCRLAWECCGRSRSSGRARGASYAWGVCIRIVMSSYRKCTPQKYKSPPKTPSARAPGAVRRRRHPQLRVDLHPRVCTPGVARQRYMLCCTCTAGEPGDARPAVHPVQRAHRPGGPVGGPLHSRYGSLQYRVLQGLRSAKLCIARMGVH